MRKYFLQYINNSNILIHIRNEGDIHRRLKYCDFKTSKHP